MTISPEETLYILLEKEHGYYLGILDITRQEQALFLKGAALNDIAALTRKKQIFVACIDELGKESAPLKAWWKAINKAHLSPSQEKIRQQIQRLDALLKEILDLDKSNTKFLEERMLALRQKTTLAQV